MSPLDDRSPQAEAASPSELAAAASRPETAAWPQHLGLGHKPRVAYLTNKLLDWKTQEPCFGGGERYCLTLASLLRDLGFEVTFFQTAFSHFEANYYGFKVIAFPVSEIYAKTDPLQAGLLALYTVSP